MHVVAQTKLPGTRLRRCLVPLLMVTAPLASLAAQTPVTDKRDTTHAQHQAPFFTKKDAILAGVFAGTTIIMIPLDRHIAQRLQDSSTQANRFFKNASTGVEAIANTFRTVS